MESAILSGASKEDLKILTELAKKLGISVKWLSKEDLEDYGLSKAIVDGKTGKTVSTSKFLDSL